ncbi:hypothetical protein L6164_022358 [Bauhinia variegata]|uniref:Uncharacterized protein n=1 Tax=Bauhinia variegata TaxID=167791 RepID=A0ACB9MFE6_BAUVA|nr:hypothetical protein L6164_022358 [Bauhinia variegata]
MEDKEPSFLQKTSSLETEVDRNLFPSSGNGMHKIESESDDPSQINGDSGHAPKQVHHFYFVKIWPTEPDSVLKIKKVEKVIEEMNHQHLQITEKIKEKVSELNHANYRLENLNCRYRGLRSSLNGQAKILNALYMVLDELQLGNNACQRGTNHSGFEGELDSHKQKLNTLMLHGNKSLAEEKKILRKMSLSQQRDALAAPFSPLEELKHTIYRNYYGYGNQYNGILREIQELQLQSERATDTAAARGKTCNSAALTKAIKDQIKLINNDPLEKRKEMMALGTKIRHTKNEVEAIKKVITLLQNKLTEKHLKKDEAYQSILKLKKLFDVEITDYNQYCWVMNNVHQLAAKKDIAALKQLYSTEVGKFMLEWNNNKAFRDDYEKRVLQSLLRQPLSRDR